MKWTTLHRIWLLLFLGFAVCGRAEAQAQAPVWFNVPVVWGATGNYTCFTRPTGNMQIAVITCDPGKLNQFPPSVREFLLAHEHGHVYQIVYTPAVLSGPSAEYDADCYAAVYLATTNIQALTDAVHWFETVLGFQGGDATHGTGVQMAQRARQCAAQAGVMIASRGSDAENSSGPRVLDASNTEAKANLNLSIGFGVVSFRDSRMRSFSVIRKDRWRGGIKPASRIQSWLV